MIDLELEQTQLYIKRALIKAAKARIAELEKMDEFGEDKRIKDLHNGICKNSNNSEINQRRS